MEGSEVVSIFSSFLGEFFDSTQVVLVVGSCESRRIRMRSWFYKLGKKEEEEAQTIGWVPKTKLCFGGRSFSDTAETTTPQGNMRETISV
jgi:hypothetical protein